MNSEFGIIFAPQIAVNHRVGFHIRRCKIYIWAHFSVGDGLPVPNRAGDFSVHIFRYGLPHNKTTLFHRLKAIETGLFLLYKRLAARNRKNVLYIPFCGTKSCVYWADIGKS